MVVEIKPDVVDGLLLKWLLAAGISWLEYHKQQVNNMNVFPVPDGDTGTNMLLTIRKAYQQIEAVEEPHIGIMAEKIARGALTGARGNSGTILSMLFRGFAQGLKNKAVMDSQSFATACTKAVDYAYETVRSVMTPVEGTILTVAREATEALTERAQHERDLKKLFDHMLLAAHQSLDNTPNLLDKLKEAGVVDAGGMGLVYIFEGMQRFIEGKPVDYFNNDAQADFAELRSWQTALIPDDEDGYGYDVQFLMLGENLDVERVRRDISAMGWSPLIDGDEQLIKVHIHVHNPGEPLTYAVGLGVELDDIVVENMQAQYLQYVQDRSDRERARQLVQAGGDVAVISVARGAGLTQLFREFGAAHVIAGGQTMNPSTADFLNAINKLQARQVLILPNNSNIIMAAEQAASLAQGIAVRVVPSKTIQQGIAAVLAYGNLGADASLAELYDAMCAQLAQVLSGEVTTATRDAVIDGVQVNQGEVIGLLNNNLVVSGRDLLAVVKALIAKTQGQDYELATIYYGEDVTEEAAAALVDALQDTFTALEFEVVHGGQPLYPYLISIE